MQMKIVIDARLISKKGIGRYLKNLIFNLQTLDNVNRYVILLKTEDLDRLNLFNKNFEVLEVNIREYSIKEQIFLPLYLARIKPDLVHFPNVNVPLFYNGSYIITIHDLIMLKGNDKNLRRVLKRFLLKFILKTKASKAKSILTVSNSIKDEIVTGLKINKDNVVVAYNGVDITSLALAPKKLSFEKDSYLFYVGSLYPHKNVDFLVKCLSDINKQLVIVGKEDQFTKKLKELVNNLNLDFKVKILGFVEDDELSLLYQNAFAFVSPTLEEGFGLPGLEAMAYGCPVIVSDLPVLREIYQDSALFFEVNNKIDLLDKIKMLGSKQIRNGLIAKGMLVTKRYPWVEQAKLTLKLYVEIGKD